jgi:hypothetical protein
MDMGLAEMLQLGTPGDGNFAKALGRTAVAGIVGGTAAEIGGGKFANGAYTAAYQHLLNDEISGRGFEGPKAPLYRRNGSALGDQWARVQVLGYVLGPIGDVLSGCPVAGIQNFLSVTIEDVFSLVFGMSYAKGYAIMHSRSIGDLVKAIAVPHYGWMTGAGWGFEPGGQDNRPHMYQNRLEYAALQHDFEAYQASRPGVVNDGSEHGKWIYNAWNGPGYEPGIFGQGIRAIGTPSFAVANLMNL